MKQEIIFLNKQSKMNWWVNSKYWTFSYFSFGNLIGIPIGIMSPAIWLIIYEIAAGIKKYK